jgi:hypothetical protein
LTRDECKDIERFGEDAAVLSKIIDPPLLTIASTRGGYAVAFHARPRFTRDMDLWVGNHPDNIVRVRSALEAFGAPAAMLVQLESALDEDVLWMGVPPLRIDIVKGVPGGNFSECYARRIVAAWDDVLVSIIARDDLIVIKRASGRPQDLLDLEALEAAEP